MRDLKNLFADVLEHHGALVESAKGSLLRVVAPEEIAKKLGINSWETLSFEREPEVGSLHVTLESDWLDRLESLFPPKVLRLSTSLSSCSSFPSHHDITHQVNKTVTLANGIYRIVNIEDCATRYCLVQIRYSATSDDRREDILHLVVNQSNGMMHRRLTEFAFQFCESNNQGMCHEASRFSREEPWDTTQVLSIIERYAATIIRSELQPFLSGMERRMAKDLERLEQYYFRLLTEEETRAAKRRVRTAGSTSASDGESRKSAIEREYQVKVSDLKQKYSMVVEVKIARIIEITSLVCRVHLVFLRRKNKRVLHLDFNPLTRKLDEFRCELCGSQEEAYFLCDEKVHFLCKSCFPTCSYCAKEYCHGCFGRHCPRCRNGKTRQGVA